MTTITPQRAFADLKATIADAKAGTPTNVFASHSEKRIPADIISQTDDTRGVTSSEDGFPHDCHAIGHRAYFLVEAIRKGDLTEVEKAELVNQAVEALEPYRMDDELIADRIADLVKLSPAATDPEEGIKPNITPGINTPKSGI